MTNDEGRLEQLHVLLRVRLNLPVVRAAFPLLALPAAARQAGSATKQKRVPRRQPQNVLRYPQYCLSLRNSHRVLSIAGCCLLLQYLLQSCSRVGRGIVEDMWWYAVDTMNRSWCGRV